MNATLVCQCPCLPCRAAITEADHEACDYWLSCETSDLRLERELMLWRKSTPTEREEKFGY